MVYNNVLTFRFPTKKGAFLCEKLLFCLISEVEPITELWSFVSEKVLPVTLELYIVLILWKRYNQVVAKSNAFTLEIINKYNTKNGEKH